MSSSPHVADNPFSPPVEAPPEGIERTVGNLFGWTSALLIVIAVVLGVSLHVELRSPAQDFMSATTYNTVFTVHGGLATFAVCFGGVVGAVGCSVVPTLTGGRVAAPGVLVAGFVFWAIAFGIAAVAVLFLSDDTQRLAIAAAVVCVYLSIALLSFVWLATARSAQPDVPPLLWGLAATSLAQIVMVASAVGSASDLLAGGTGWSPVSAVQATLLPFAIGAAVQALRGPDDDEGTSGLLIALLAAYVGLACLSALPLSLAIAALIPLPVRLFAAPTLVVLLLIRVFGARSAPLAVRLLVAGFALTLGLGELTKLYLSALSVDVHLHDTYFVVGVMHMRMGAVLFMAVPAALLAMAPESFPSRSRVLPFAAIVIALAINVSGFAMLFLGHQGMPRRYYAYLPEYQTGHQVLLVAALALTAGMVAFVVGVLRGRRPVATRALGRDRAPPQP